MANDENENRATTIDLNLYLSPPHSPPPRTLNLGSNLSLSSLPSPSSSGSSLQWMPETMSPHQQSLDTKQRKPDEEKIRLSTYFDCNICLEIAKDPVVTTCGHLFCWPCLYQWLYVHSDYMKCPVCKGEVIEDNITPIYGRGCSISDSQNKDEENRDSGLLIPSRPRGNRMESCRRHFRPVSPRVGEGIANSWRRVLNYPRNNRSMISGHENGFMDEISSESPAILAGSMAGGLWGEQGIIGGGNEIDIGEGLLFLSDDGLAAMNSEILRVVGRFRESAGSYGSSSVNSPNSGQFVSEPIVGARAVADQASGSSTAAVMSIEGSARDALVEAGSSRPCGRKRGSSSSSSDDEGSLRAPKRRRLH